MCWPGLWWWWWLSLVDCVEMKEVGWVIAKQLGDMAAETVGIVFTTSFISLTWPGCIS